MSRMPRIQLENSLSYVSTGGDNKRIVFKDQSDYRAYYELLSRYKEHHNFKLFAYCLAPKNITLLIEPSPTATISQIMHDLNTNYTKYFNKKYDRSGHLFQERYRMVLAEKMPNLLKLTAYIHLLPKILKLSVDKGIYQYTSYPTYLAKDLNDADTPKLKSADTSESKSADTALLKTVEITEPKPADIPLLKSDESGKPDIAAEIGEVLELLEGKSYQKFVSGMTASELKKLDKELGKKTVLGSEEFAQAVKSKAGKGGIKIKAPAEKGPNKVQESGEDEAGAGLPEAAEAAEHEVGQAKVEESHDGKVVKDGLFRDDTGTSPAEEPPPQVTPVPEPAPERQAVSEPPVAAVPQYDTPGSVARLEPIPESSQSRPDVKTAQKRKMGIIAYIIIEIVIVVLAVSAVTFYFQSKSDQMKKRMDREMARKEVEAQDRLLRTKEAVYKEMGDKLDAEKAAYEEQVSMLQSEKAKAEEAIIKEKLKNAAESWIGSAREKLSAIKDKVIYGILKEPSDLSESLKRCYLRDYSMRQNNIDMVKTGSPEKPYSGYVTIEESLYVEKVRTPEVSDIADLLYTVSRPIKVNFEYRDGVFEYTNEEYGRQSAGKGWPEGVL